jgi:hypothetical protein
MRQFVQALELRLQDIEGEVANIPTSTGSSTDSSDTEDGVFSPVGHTHVESEITNLQGYLLNVNGESIFDLVDVLDTNKVSGNVLVFNGTSMELASSGSSFALVNDPSPELGAALNGSNQNIFDVNDLTMNFGFLKEQAAAAVDIPGRGQLWVKDDIPNKFYFTDDDGKDRQITGIQGSFTAGFTGFSADPAAIIYYRVSDGVVTVMIKPSTALGTSNGTSFVITGIPATLRPATSQQVVIAGAIDNGSNIAGMTLELQSGASAWLLGAALTNPGGGGWTGSGSKGFATTDGFTFSYLLTNPT